MKELDLSHLSLNFSPMDYYKYPSLKLAYDAIQRGGIYPCILNASNEAAVSLFLNDKISFLDIFKINEDSLNRFGEDVDLTLDNILKYDKIVKEYIYKMYS